MPFSSQGFFFPSYQYWPKTKAYQSWINIVIDVLFAILIDFRKLLSYDRERSAGLCKPVELWDTGAWLDLEDGESSEMSLSAASQSKSARESHGGGLSRDGNAGHGCSAQLCTSATLRTLPFYTLLRRLPWFPAHARVVNQGKIRSEDYYGRDDRLFSDLTPAFGSHGRRFFKFQ